MANNQEKLKRIEYEVLNCLVKAPASLRGSGLRMSTFRHKVSKSIFKGIELLVEANAATISVDMLRARILDDAALSVAYKENNGEELLLSIAENENIGDLDYHIGQLRSAAAERDLEKMGVAIPEGQTADSVIGDLIKSLTTISDTLTDGKNTIGKYAYEDAQHNYENISNGARVGAPCRNEIFSAITNGCVRGEVNLVCAGTGVGKTRGMLGEAAWLAYPWSYDKSAGTFVESQVMENGYRTMYIGNEIQVSKLQPTIWANLSGVNQDAITKKNYQGDEEQRVLTAMRQTADDRWKRNLVLAQLEEFSMKEIERIIRYRVKYDNVTHVFVDYLSFNADIDAEYHGGRMTSQQIMIDVSNRLKKLAEGEDIYIRTATQGNAKADEKGFVNSATVIADAKGIANKVDFVALLKRVNQESLQDLMPKITSLGLEVPNHELHIIKNRNNQHSSGIIYQYIDGGTCRTKDLFFLGEDGKEIHVPRIRYERA